MMLTGGIQQRFTASVTAVGTTGLSLSLPREIVVNDIWLLVLCHYGGGWATVPAGWTLVGREISGVVRGEVYWHRVDGTEVAPYLVTGTSTTILGFITAYAHCLTTGSPIDASVFRANASGATGTDGITTSTAYALVVSLAAKAGPYATGQWTAANLPGPLIECVDYTLNGLNVGLAHLLFRTPGATGVTAYTGTAVANVGMCLALLPDPTWTGFSGTTIVGAPTNTTAETAYEVTDALPVTLIQDASAGTYPQTLWYKYPTTTEGAIRFFGWTNALLGVFRPTITAYYGTPEALTQTLARGMNLLGWFAPFIAPTVPGTDIYIKVVNQDFYTIDDQTDATFVLSAEAPPDESYPEGSLLINDDTSGFPAVVLDPTDGHVVRVVPQFPYGEFADVLDNGIMAYKAQDREYIDLYDSSVSLITSVAVFPGHWEQYEDDPPDFIVDGEAAGTPRISSDHAHTFYLKNQDQWDGVQTVKTLSDAGVIGATSWVLPRKRFGGIAAALDGSFLYYGDGYGPNVYRHDLLNDVDWGIWLTVVDPTINENVAFYEMAVLGDGTVLLPVNHGSSPYGGYVRHYAADATLLHTYDLRGAIEGGNLNLNRIARDTTDDTFWMWQHHWTTSGQRLGKSQFSQIRIADGAILTQFTLDDWKAGIGPYSNDDDNPQRWGPSYSCPLIVLRAASAPTFSPSASSSGSASGSRSASASRAPGEVEIRLIRRLRQSPHVSDEQFWLYIHQFQLDLETGRGLATGQGVDPQIMLSWSDDGGHTWSDEHWVSAGAQGAYAWRAIWRRLGRSRDRVWRVVMSDPVPWRLLDAYVTLGKGMS